jgi:FAD/FMN-containing dehydrogenase
LRSDAIEKFKSGLRGVVIQPGESGYDEARSIWNAMIDRKPALIARCLGVADAAMCVNFARQNNLTLSVKSGGHNIAGLAVCDGGLMLDLSLMRGVWVDAINRTAHAQAGCLLGDMDRETQVHGLATVLGFVSTTGVAGLTLGGGYGYLTRRFGWSCDNVTSMEVITAEGRVVHASERENPDLFWGLRGGGGNFGIVTGFDYKLHPIGPEIMAGAIAWSATEAQSVLEMWRIVAEESAPELTCVPVLRLAPPAPWLQKEFHGKPIVVLFICYSGATAEGAAKVASIKAFGSPIGDVVQRRSYVSQQSILDVTQPKGRRYYWKSEFLPGIASELLTQVIESAGRVVSPHSGIVLFPIDGALKQFPEDHSAAGNRDAAIVLTITASWESSEDDEANIGWARTSWQELRRFSTGGTYVNFLTEEEGAERIRAAYGSNYERLVQIKTKWDPENLFRTNKNIPPDSG